MIVRMYEIRDRMTFIPAIAIRLAPGTERDRYLLARAGYGISPADQGEYVLLVRIDGGDGVARSDPHDWGDRTMHVAHLEIIENWPESGSVIDVEYILGETSAPKESEAAS